MGLEAAVFHCLNGRHKSGRINPRCVKTDLPAAPYGADIFYYGISAVTRFQTCKVRSLVESRLADQAILAERRRVVRASEASRLDGTGMAVSFMRLSVADSAGIGSLRASLILCRISAIAPAGTA